MKKNDLTVKYVSIIHAVAHIDNLGADNERRKRLTQMQMILRQGGGGGVILPKEVTLNTSQWFCKCVGTKSVCALLLHYSYPPFAC